MGQNTSLKILNKATKLCIFSRVISLYLKDFSAFYVIYYTQTIIVINIVFLKSSSLWSEMELNCIKTKFCMCHLLPGSFVDSLLKLNDIQSKWLCKFRTNNIKLPVETGRWENIPRNDRICRLCFTGIGDEFHYLFLCKHETVELLRNKYIPLYFSKHPCVNKMKGLLSLCHVELLKNISQFVKELSALF